MKYNDNGTWKEIYVKALDSMPVGTEVDFDGTSADIPVGWEQVQSHENVTIETGSNENGTYIKFSNGTMICYGIISKGVQYFNNSYYEKYCRSSTENMTITYPQEFISTPSCNINCIGPAKSIILASQGTATISPAFTIICPIVATPEEVIVNYIAIGKWK